MPLSDLDLDNIGRVTSSQNVKGAVVRELVAALRAARGEAEAARLAVDHMRSRAATQAKLAGDVYAAWHDTERAAICEDIRLRILALL